MSKLMFKLEVVNEIGNAAMFFIADESTINLFKSHYSSAIISCTTLELDSFDLEGITISDIRVVIDYIYSNE